MKKSKVVIIGSCPDTDTEYIAIIAKKLSEATGVCFKVMRQSIDDFNNQIQKVGTSSEDLKKSFENINPLLQELKQKVLYEPKSKYINNPRNNFKNKSITQKRNNRNHYKK